MNAMFKFKGEVLNLGLAAAAIAACLIVQVPDGRAGVTQNQRALEAGEQYSAAVSGIFDVPSASATTFAKGQDVWIDVANDVAVPFSTALIGGTDFRLGKASVAKASGVTTVRVDFNAEVSCQVFAPELDCTDATATAILIPAEQNTTGFIVEEIFSEITEGFAGDTEDQGIVTVADEDDSAIATLTPTDAGADATGDIIVGYSRPAATTGAELKKVAAGKAVKASVSQAASGTSLAGKMVVYIKVTPRSA